MKTGEFRRRAAIGGLAAALLLGSAASPAAPGQSGASAPATRSRAAQRPNILFILIDDMGFADLSIMGNRKIATPNLDRLASDGVLMTRFYDASPICSPSRAGFFTGRFPAEIGFHSYLNDRAYNARIGQVNWLDPNLPNLARMLKSAGYATAHFGKWHMGGGRDVGDAPWPAAYGFDEVLTTNEGLGPRVLVSDDGRALTKRSAALGQGPIQYEKKTELTGLYAAKSLDFAQRHKGRPWFVQMWLNDVHDVWIPDAQSLEETKGKGSSAEDDRYLATIVKMDRTLGHMIDRLKATGQFDNTLIIVTSDNGPSAAKNMYADGATAPGSAANLRGRKGSLYEGGIRQPLILSWPAYMRARTRDEVSVGHGVDLLPTLAEAARVPVPAGGQGISLLKVMKGQAIRTRPPVYWAFGNPNVSYQPGGPFLKRDVSPPLAIRDGDWKLLTSADYKTVELYDLRRDPSEKTNRATHEPRRMAMLLAKLKAWRTRIQ